MNKTSVYLIAFSGLQGKGAPLEAKRGLILILRLRLFTNLSKWSGRGCTAAPLCRYWSRSLQWDGCPQCARLCACVNSCRLLIGTALFGTVSRAERWFGFVGDETWRSAREEDAGRPGACTRLGPSDRTETFNLGKRKPLTKSHKHDSTLCFPGLSVSEEAPHHRVTTGSLADHQRAHSLQPPSTPVLPRRFLPPQSRNSPGGQYKAYQEMYNMIHIFTQRFTVGNEAGPFWNGPQSNDFKSISNTLEHLTEHNLVLFRGCWKAFWETGATRIPKPHAAAQVCNSAINSFGGSIFSTSPHVQMWKKSFWAIEVKVSQVPNTAVGVRSNSRVRTPVRIRREESALWSFTPVFSHVEINTRSPPASHSTRSHLLCISELVIDGIEAKLEPNSEISFRKKGEHFKCVPVVFFSRTCVQTLSPSLLAALSSLEMSYQTEGNTKGVDANLKVRPFFFYLGHIFLFSMSIWTHDSHIILTARRGRARPYT